MVKAYRWATPRDWLDQSSFTAEDLWRIFGDLVDSDQIQDALQTDMEEDGYFKPRIVREDRVPPGWTVEQ